MAALGIVPSGPKKGLAAGMVSSFLGDLLVAFVLLHIVLWSGAATFGTGAFIGFVCWLGLSQRPSFLKASMRAVRLGCSLSIAATG